ncbi:YodC family protein [Xanthomonas vesicatoria]|uniref:YodC family protein n=1 Tax=Xanthomonas vesicatoria TaxID=56460 RepID=UPI0031C246EB|nr:YodC family protein [Xanthomonas vesicatoria]MDG4483905.1 DUF2158 domain-containing protein [Xanthomonas vesicatoria]
MSNKYSVGEIVKLRSGGPDMTVQEVPVAGSQHKNHYRCQWFAGKKLESGSFQEESLELVPV